MPTVKLPVQIMLPVMFFSPAFQFVKTLPGITVVSGAFLMFLKDKEFGDDGLMVFADCAVHPNPTDKELAEIAVATARTTQEQLQELNPGLPC